MTSATARKIELPEEQLRELFSSLNKHEREHLGLSLMDIIREDVVDLEDMKHLFTSWYMTAAVRHHPDFEPQLKEYRRLLESGELFEDSELSQETIEQVQASFAG